MERATSEIDGPTVGAWGGCVGMFQVGVTVANPADASRNFAERFWVDTGALYTFIPEDRLHAIAVAPLLSRDLILADGRRERRLLGEARLTIEGLEGSLTCPIIFAPPGSLSTAEPGSSSLWISATSGGVMESCVISATRHSTACRCCTGMPVTRRVRSSTPRTRVPPWALAKASNSTRGSTPDSP